MDEVIVLAVLDKLIELVEIPTPAEKSDAYLLDHGAPTLVATVSIERRDEQMFFCEICLGTSDEAAEILIEAGARLHEHLEFLKAIK